MNFFSDIFNELFSDIFNELFPTFAMNFFSDISYLQSILPPDVEPEFYVYLQNLTPKDIKIHALAEGTIVFPR